MPGFRGRFVLVAVCLLAMTVLFGCSSEAVRSAPAEPNWDNATQTKIAGGEFVYDSTEKVWLCYSKDSPDVVWKLTSTEKYPLPKELVSADVCGCGNFRGVNIVFLAPKEWDDPSERELGRQVKRSVVIPIDDTKIETPSCGGTCSCHDDEKK